MLPKNLSIPQLRKEIRRRLKISEQLGLIKKPRKWSAGLRLDQEGHARNHHWTVKEDAACMGACRYQAQITPRSFMAIAPKSIGKSVQQVRSTSDTWKTWQFSLAWLSPREGAEYDVTAFLNTRLQTLSLPLESEQETQQDLIILVYAYLATHDISTYIWEQCCVNPDTVLDFDKECPPMKIYTKGVEHISDIPRGISDLVRNLQMIQKTYDRCLGACMTEKQKTVHQYCFRKSKVQIAL